jgi:hypothetical protein
MHGSCVSVAGMMTHRSAQYASPSPGRNFVNKFYPKETTRLMGCEACAHSPWSVPPAPASASASILARRM